jgi:hypothetical protein
MTTVGAAFLAAPVATATPDFTRDAELSDLYKSDAL